MEIPFPPFLWAGNPFPTLRRYSLHLCILFSFNEKNNNNHTHHFGNTHRIVCLEIWARRFNCRVRQCAPRCNTVSVYLPRTRDRCASQVDSTQLSNHRRKQPIPTTRLEEGSPPPAKPAPTPAPKPIVEIPPAPPPLTYTLVLTGIVQNGSDRMAVIEDRQHNEGAFLRRGEMLKDVLVRDILAEHIRLVRGETTVQLFLGESIEYGIDGRLLFDTTGTAKMPKPTDQTNKPSPPPVGGASLPRPSPTGGDGQSLIERMRERRRRELNQ